MSKIEISKGEARIIDLLERIGGIILYKQTNMTQGDVAKALCIGNDRASEILKKVSK